MRKNICLASFLFIICSCNLIQRNPKIPVNIYNLRIPEQKLVIENSDIEIRPFKQESGYDKRMVFRSSENFVQFDEHNRWSQDPEDMLRKYLKLKFSSSGRDSGKTIYISGNILVFECNLKENTTNLTVELQLRDEEKKLLWKKVVTYKTEIESKTAEGFAKAMDNSVNSLSELLFNQIKKNCK